MTTVEREVVVLGAGPAGLTAAIYCARADLRPLVFEGEPSSTSDQPGGQLMLTTDVENYPGFPEGVMGPNLMMDFRAQAVRFGAEMQTEKVTKVDLSSNPFKIWIGENGLTSDPDCLARALIVSTGAKSLMLGLPEEDQLIGRGLSTCATCDGFFFRGQEIAVVGGGDSAMEEATFLTKFASKVTIIHRRDQLRASKIMQERAFANERIEFLWNHVVTAIHGTESLEGVRVSHTKTGEEQDIPLGGLFIAIGHSPNTDIFAGQLKMKENGYLITEPDSSRTSVEGVFACGDVQDDVYRQAVTAAGSGCMAAIDAERWLESRSDLPEASASATLSSQ